LRQAANLIPILSKQHRCLISNHQSLLTVRFLVAAMLRRDLCSADIQDRTISRGFLSRHLDKLFNITAPDADTPVRRNADGSLWLRLRRAVIS
jgi:hypothetical protein